MTIPPVRQPRPELVEEIKEINLGAQNTPAQTQDSRQQPDSSVQEEIKEERKSSGPQFDFDSIAQIVHRSRSSSSSRSSSTQSLRSAARSRQYVPYSDPHQLQGQLIEQCHREQTQKLVATYAPPQEPREPRQNPVKFLATAASKILSSVGSLASTVASHVRSQPKTPKPCRFNPLTFVATGYSDGVNISHAQASQEIASYGVAHEPHRLEESFFVSRGLYWKLRLHTACVNRGFIPKEFFNCDCAPRSTLRSLQYHLGVKPLGGVVSSLIQFDNSFHLDLEIYIRRAGASYTTHRSGGPTGNYYQFPHDKIAAYRTKIKPMDPQVLYDTIEIAPGLAIVLDEERSAYLEYNSIPSANHHPDAKTRRAIAMAMINSADKPADFLYNLATNQNPAATKAIVSHTQRVPRMNVVQNYAFDQLANLDPERVSAIDFENEKLKATFYLSTFARARILFAILVSDKTGIYKDAIYKVLLTKKLSHVEAYYAVAAVDQYLKSRSLNLVLKAFVYLDPVFLPKGNKVPVNYFSDLLCTIRRYNISRILNGFSVVYILMICALLV